MKRIVRRNTAFAGLLLTAALVLGLLVVALPAQADSLDASCLNTTYVDGTNNTSKKKNFGAAVDLKIRGTTVKIGYLECVVTGVPAGATGISATLVVYSRTANTAHTVRLHNQPTAWTEGTGGDAGATGSVNWNDLHTYDAALLSSANGDAVPGAGELVNLPASNVTGNGTFRFALETAATTDQLYASDDYISDVTRRPKLTVSYTPPAATTTTTTVPPPPSSGSVYGLGDADSDGANLTAAVNKACGIGAKEFRVDGKWWKVEGTQGTYSWTLFDPAMAAAASCTGMRVLWLASYTPTWARPASCTSGDICLPDPTKYSAFAAYAAAAVSRYPQIAKVEVWNEPNADFARPRDPAAMAAIQKVVYPAVKAARSSVKVLTAGLEPADTVAGGNYSPQDFLSGMYTAGVKGYMDAVGIHPYCWEQWNNAQNCPRDFATWSTWSRMASTTVNLRSVMHTNTDDALPLEATEFGAPSASVGTTNQRNTVVDGYNLWPGLVDAYGNHFTVYPDGSPAALYVYRTQELGGDTFGIFTSTGTEKLAATAYGQCTSVHQATGTIGTQPESC